MSFFLKIFIIVIILCIPLVIVVMVLTPMAAKKQGEDYWRAYRLGPSFTRDELTVIVSRMKQDQSFKFYFTVLDGDNVAYAIEDLYQDMTGRRDREKYLAFLEEGKVKVESLVSIFNSLQYPDSFFTSPERYPDLTRSLWLLLYEEFKLTILGTCYKATYDPQFQFQWQEGSLAAAQKLFAVAARLPQESRNILARTFTQNLRQSREGN